LREISDALPYVNGKTILSRVKELVKENEQLAAMTEGLTCPPVEE
jgi:hypothetical protein